MKHNGKTIDLGLREGLEYFSNKYTPKEACTTSVSKEAKPGRMTDKENIDGYVSKDSLYRLLSNYRMAQVLTEKERSIIHDIIVAIKDMPNEKEEEE